TGRCEYLQNSIKESHLPSLSQHHQLTVQQLPFLLQQATSLQDLQRSSRLSKKLYLPAFTTFNQLYNFQYAILQGLHRFHRCCRCFRSSSCRSSKRRSSIQTSGSFRQPNPSRGECSARRPQLCLPHPSMG